MSNQLNITPLMGANNPIAEMMREVVMDSIREVVRDEIATAMVDVNKFIERLNTLFDAGKDSKNLILKALFKDME